MYDPGFTCHLDLTQPATQGLQSLHTISISLHCASVAGEHSMQSHTVGHSQALPALKGDAKAYLRPHVQKQVQLEIHCNQLLCVLQLAAVNGQAYCV